MSKTLHEAEVHYLPPEKAILAVVHATCKLPHYFQVGYDPRADYTRRIAKWGTILGAFDIKYMPRTSIKGQVLANLVAEFAKSLLEDKIEKQDMDGKLAESPCKNLYPGGYTLMVRRIWSGASSDIS